MLLLKVTPMLQNWSTMCPRDNVPDFKSCLNKVRVIATRPHRLPGADWKTAVLTQEAKALLVDVNELEKTTLEGKWISFAESRGEAVHYLVPPSTEVRWRCG